MITNPPVYDYLTLFPIYTYPPFISGKLTWSQKNQEVSSDSPHCSGGEWYHENSYPHHRSGRCHCASPQNSNQTLKLLIKRGLGVIWFLDHPGCRVFSIGLVYACLCFLTGISFSLHHFGEMLWLESTSMKHIYVVLILWGFNKRTSQYLLRNPNQKIVVLPVNICCDFQWYCDKLFQMFLSRWKWQSGIKIGSLPSPYVLWVVIVYERKPW